MAKSKTTTDTTLPPDVEHLAERMRAPEMLKELRREGEFAPYEGPVLSAAQAWAAEHAEELRTLVHAVLGRSHCLDSEEMALRGLASRAAVDMPR